jgi:hypothetical protein
VAYQETYDNRKPLGQYENDPAAHPSSPAANNDISYYDLSTALFWNYIQVSLPGDIDHPRKQGNASLNWFLGNHDLKLGLDYQDTGWGNKTQTAPTAYGSGYNRNRPGGFTTPLLLREYTGTASIGGTETTSETWGLFVRDRLSAGDHWTFNLGLRLDDQTHSNEMGAEIFQSTDLAPRVTAVYDVHGDSTLLVTAGGGRYYDWIPMDAAGYFNVVPGGRAQYDQYAWSAAQQAYIGPPRRVTTSTNIASNTIQPSYKDELTLGFEWAFHPNWAFKANALYKEAKDPYTYAQQIVQVNGVNTVANVFENISDGTLDRTSVTFLVSRRYRDNWSMTASYTLSETKGNCYTVYHVSCQHDYGEFRALTNAAGVPLSVVNRDGYVSNHLPHELKVRGNRLFALGKQHTINLGGFARYQSGSRWQLVADRTVAAPVVPAANVSITEYLEEAGNRSLDDTYQIDLNASWQFPIAGGFSASLLLEILNATDQQEQMFVTEAGMRSGNPTTLAATANFQSPRAYRALVTLSF